VINDSAIDGVKLSKLGWEITCVCVCVCVCVRERERETSVPLRPDMKNNSIYQWLEGRGNTSLNILCMSLCVLG